MLHSHPTRNNEFSFVIFLLSGAQWLRLVGGFFEFWNSFPKVLSTKLSGWLNFSQVGSWRDIHPTRTCWFISSPPSFKVAHTVFSDRSSWLASSGKFDRNQWKISWKMLSQNSAWNKQHILPSQKFYTLWTALTGNCIKAESPGSKTFWDLLFNFLCSFFYFIANVSKNRSGLDFQKETITLKDLLIWLEHNCWSAWFRILHRLIW